MSDRYAIAVARFYEELAERLERGARAAFAEAGIEAEALYVPGAFELPLAASYAARSGRFAGAPDQPARFPEIDDAAQLVLVRQP